MNILVATKLGQGTRHNDFSFTSEGELVYLGSECTHESIDGRCGCRRALVGMESHRATTTFKVADVPMDYVSYRVAIRQSLNAAGWTMLSDAYVDAMIARLLAIAGRYPIAAVLERRGSRIQKRKI